MKIAFISVVRDPWGGSEELWAKTAAIALSQGHDVSISAFRKEKLVDQLKDLQDKGARIFLRRGYISPDTKTYRRIFRKAVNFLLDNIFNPFENLVKNQPDIIIYSASCYSIVDDKPLIKILNKTGIPYLINNQVNVEYSRPINSDQALTVRTFYHSAKKVLFVSQRNLQVAQRHLVSKIENSSIIRNPVNLKDTSLVAFPENERIQFCMVANVLVNHKGHDILLEVLSSDKWKKRSWDLKIYGSGNDENYVKELCNFYGLNSRVHLMGRTKDIRMVWRENQILLMPSLNEGIPLAVVEAMLCGRPVVATDTGGHMEWIDENITGFIAEGANVYSFDNALERAWKNKSNWKQMGELAHEAATARFDPESEHSFLNIILENGNRS